MLLLRKGKKKYVDENWLIVLTTDHGGYQRDHSGRHPESLRNWMIFCGDTVFPCKIPGEPDLSVIAPTIFYHLGIEVKKEWEWEGEPILFDVPDKLTPYFSIVSDFDLLCEQNEPYFNVTVWRPKVNDGHVIIGDYSHDRLTKPHKAIIAKNEIVKSPIGYNLIWSNKNLWIWEAIPPEGFLVLGHIATVTSDPPALSLVGCLPKDLVSPTESFWNLVWRDWEDGAFWSLSAFGLFFASPQSPRGKTFSIKDL